MPEKKDEQDEQRREPQEFGEHTRKPSSENAHEQGWGLNQDERTRLPKGKQPWEGGTDYDYGAQDFGDTPEDTSAAKPTPQAAEEFRPGKEKDKKGEAA
jgi:hypothetical protein